MNKLLGIIIWCIIVGLNAYAISHWETISGGMITVFVLLIILSTFFCMPMSFPHMINNEDIRYGIMLIFGLCTIGLTVVIQLSTYQNTISTSLYTNKIEYKVVKHENKNITLVFSDGTSITSTDIAHYMADTLYLCSIIYEDMTGEIEISSDKFMLPIPCDSYVVE